MRKAASIPQNHVMLKACLLAKHFLDRAKTPSMGVEQFQVWVGVLVCVLVNVHFRYISVSDAIHIYFTMAIAVLVAVTCGAIEWIPKNRIAVVAAAVAPFAFDIMVTCWDAAPKSVLFKALVFAAVVGGVVALVVSALASRVSAKALLDDGVVDVAFSCICHALVGAVATASLAFSLLYPGLVLASIANGDDFSPYASGPSVYQGSFYCMGSSSFEASGHEVITA